MRSLLTAIILLYSGIAFAGSATLTWTPYVEGPTFKELRLYRGYGASCGAGGVALSTQIATIPKGTPTPSTYIDTTAPDVIGMVCYELAAANTIPIPGGTTTTTLESAHSNRAVKFVTSSVTTPTGLEVAP